MHMAWISAFRVKTLTASVVPVCVGSALAVHDGVFAWLPALAALLGALAIQIGTNLHNDAADHLSGADSADRLGPARAAQNGWLTAAQIRRGSAVAFGTATLIGAYLVYVGGWPIVAIGLASIAAGYAYTGGPFPLGYHGLGDLFVFAFFGVIAVCGTYYVQGLTITPAVLALSCAIGALNTAILVVNNLRDRQTDAKAGKRTLAVICGERFARNEYIALIIAAYVIPAGLVAFGFGDGLWLLPMLSLPLAYGISRRFLRASGVQFNPILSRTAGLSLAYAMLFCLGASL